MFNTFYKYPYTDLYNLNLDWIIQAIKELQEIVAPLDNVVNSVNGMTGDVEITKAMLTQILGNLVETFNGRSGEVELTAEDVNATLIDITWTSDPGDTIEDLTQTELDEMYASGKRVLIFVNNLGVADQVYFLQYYDNHAMPQEYSPTSALAGVASFNGQTGNVTATGADLATSGTDARTIAESLEDLEESTVPVTRTVNNKPLSANVSVNAEDIPSQAITGATDVEMALGNLNNSKVPNARTVNGKSLLNNITLNDEDIPSQVISGETTIEGVLTDLDSRISSQSQQIGNETLPTTAQTLTGAIAENADGIEELNTPITLNPTFLNSTLSDGSLVRVGKLVTLNFRFRLTSVLSANNSLQIGSGFPIPISTVYTTAILQGASSNENQLLYIDTSGNMTIYAYTQIGTSNFIDVSLTYVTTN